MPSPCSDLLNLRESTVLARRRRDLTVSADPHDRQAPDQMVSTWIATFSSLTVLIVGVLYVFGALLTVGQLQGAAVPVSQTVVLIPLQSFLARGIAAVTEPTLVLTGVSIPLIASATAGFIRSERTDPHSPSARPPSSGAASASRALSRSALVLLTVVYVLVLPPAMGIVLMGVVLAAPALVPLLRPLSARARYVISSFLAFVAVLFGSVLSAFTSPEPLARAYLYTSHAIVSGSFIVHTDSTWYLAEGSSIRAVPESQVMRAVIGPRFQDRPASALTATSEIILQRNLPFPLSMNVTP